MLKFTSVLAAAGFAMLPLASQAATPTLGDVLKASGISANGYVDFGSTINNRGTNGFGGIGGIQGATDGGFRLNQVGLAVTTGTSEGFNGTLDLLAGQDAVAPALATDGAGDIKLKQAYISYANSGFTVMGGRFITLSGFEVSNSSQNQNATRSLLFTFVQPALHTGVRTSYAFGKVFTLTAGLVNSTGLTAATAGAVPSDNNHNKSYEAQVAVTPFDGFNNAVTVYQGQESTSGAATNSPLLIDAVSSLQITKAISVGLNYDHLRDVVGGQQTNGVALYSSFQICDALRLGGRAEFVKQTNNPAGTLGTNLNNQEYTFTTDYSVSKNFNVLSDLRWDKQTGYAPTGTLASEAKPFGNGTGANGGNALTSLTIKGIYRF